MLLDLSDVVDAADDYLDAMGVPYGDDGIELGLAEIYTELGNSVPQNITRFATRWLADNPPPDPLHAPFQVVADYFEAIAAPNACN